MNGLRGPVWVMPMMKPAWARETYESLDVDIRDRLIVVDNSTDGFPRDAEDRMLAYVRRETNLGCSASWNIGRHEALSTFRPLVIVSEAVVFCDGGKAFDFLATTMPDVGIIRTDNAWHLTAIGWETMQRVGAFDVGFWPIYFEDTDYEHRARLARHPVDVVTAPNIEGSFIDKGHARTWREGWVSVDYNRQAWYYAAKWGGPPGAETYDEPWGGQ